MGTFRKDKYKEKGVQYTCGCTTAICTGDMEATCLKCGKPFTKLVVVKQNGMGVKSINGEKVIELVADKNLQVEKYSCQHCSDQGWIKAFTQEWDRIKCQHAPCPTCHKEEWLQWSAGKWLITMK